MTNTKPSVEGKYELELNFVGDGRTFLNFWDWANGNDVVVRLKDGKIYSSDGDGNELEITFQQFVDMVKDSIAKRTV